MGTLPDLFPSTVMASCVLTLISTRLLTWLDQSLQVVDRTSFAGVALTNKGTVNGYTTISSDFYNVILGPGSGGEKPPTCAAPLMGLFPRTPPHALTFTPSIHAFMLLSPTATGHTPLSFSLFLLSFSFFCCAQHTEQTSPPPPSHPAFS
jgi:hypothetical protein